MLILKRRQIVKSLGLLSASALIACQSKRRAVRGREHVNVALIGLGYYSKDLLAPALQLTQHCRLAGIVTGTPSKIPVWQAAYNIPDRNIYNYENFDAIANNPDIDAVYIVLPNSMHKEFAIRAANAGKHVWCEKPMALNSAECQDMIRACAENKVQLTIGYRLQHEPNTRDVIAMATTKPFGRIRKLTADAGFRDNRQDHWRLKAAMGGGAMYDMGVYPLNAARYATGEEPIAVTARQEVLRPEVFKEVDEVMHFTLEFPSGAVATCSTSFGEYLNPVLRVDCENGWYKLDPFQSYSGVKGITSTGQALSKQIVNQQALQMDNDALAIMNNTAPLVPGEEGARDIRVVEAIFKSADSGRRVVI